MSFVLKEMFDIKNIVKNKAKYQKVMLLFDDCVSEFQTKDVYELIKGDCVYNQMNVNHLDVNELMNGYRMIIFYMTGQSYLKLDIIEDEIVKIFIPTDEYIVPFFAANQLDDSKNANYLILNNHYVDNSLFSSVYMNRVYTQIYNFIYLQERVIEYKQVDTNIKGQQLIDFMNNEKSNQFIDLKILQENGLNIDKLILVDYLLLAAFELFLESIRNKRLSMVDVYKVVQNDIKKVNIYYEMMNNYSLLEILNLNFNCLHSMIINSKERILELMKDEYNNEDIDNVIESIRDFARNDGCILRYLYFYNIFSL